MQAWFGAASMAVIGYGMLFAALFFGDFLLRFLPLLKPLRDGMARLVRLTHSRCRLLHQIMLPGLALALIHILLLSGQGLGPFKACTAAYFAVAAAAYLRHTLRRTGDRPRQTYSVAQTRRESDSVVTLELAPQAGRAIRFLPGQFLYLRPLSGALPGEEHPFSISCGPGRDTVSVTVKNLGDFTARMGEARPGDRMALDGPYGRFSYRCAQRRGPLALVAGGIGITPMLSMLHGLAEEDPGRSATLIWSVRTEEELVRREELEALGERLEDFAFVPVLSRGAGQGARAGRVDRSLLAGVLEERGLLSQGRMATDATFFVCGPPAMARIAIRALRDLGASPARIHAERFAF